MATDFADWIDAIVVGAVSTDSTDWARQITVISGALPGDFPDWVEATSVSGAGPGSAIQYVSGASHTNSASGTNLTINAPATITSGNLLVAFIGSFLSSSSAALTSTGWTQVYHFWPGSSFQGNTFVLTKTATNSEPASYTFTGPATFYTGAVIQWAKTSALDGTPSSNSSSTSQTNTYPSVTPGVAGDMLVGWTNGVQSAPVVWQPPAGTTQADTTFVSSDLGLAVWYLPLSTTSPTGTKTGLQTDSASHIDSTLLLHA